jgi:hypothetical protein
MLIRRRIAAQEGSGMNDAARRLAENEGFVKSTMAGYGAAAKLCATVAQPDAEA